jgi:hypothetical protein
MLRSTLGEARSQSADADVIPVRDGKQQAHTGNSLLIPRKTSRRHEWSGDVVRCCERVDRCGVQT